MKKWIAGAMLASLVVSVGCSKSSPPAVAQEPPVATTNVTTQPSKQPDMGSKDSDTKNPKSESKVDDKQASPTTSTNSFKEGKEKAGKEPEKGSPAQGSPATPLEEGKVSSEQQPNRQPEQQGKPSEDAPSNSGDSDEKLKEVVKKYEDQLVQLKAANLQKLNGLYDQVLAASKKGGSPSEIGNKFAQQATAMQEESQAQVNQVLLQLKNELTALQLATDSVNQLRSAYYSEVSKAEQQFTDKLRSSLGK
ncbi:hypothetical protein ACFQ88_39165 [Paenibacillus sp. NPDC056579]|uniref:hypothetical protein n=1 Tax=Paenibacillus sp. NPDC056579 TaxID=3345871 RepID=UPI00369B30C3